MYLNMLKGKIHRATVVQAELDYVGINGNAADIIQFCLYDSRSVNFSL